MTFVCVALSDIAMSAEGLPEFGFVFDIDGVLIRGWDLLPNAKESLKKVHDSGVPYLFVTNNGMDTEDERANILSKAVRYTGH